MTPLTRDSRLGAPKCETIGSEIQRLGTNPSCYGDICRRPSICLPEKNNMITIPKKVRDRLVKQIPRFQKILADAKNRDIHESDTVTIVVDMLESVFGFDKYSEVTSEQTIKATYCDLAVKIDGSIKYLIEVKAIGLDLKDNHLRQAVNYGATEGIPWVVLSNGMKWQIHKITFERPISSELVAVINFEQISHRNQDHLMQVFLLCRQGIKKQVIEEYHERSQIVNRFMVAAIAQTDPVVSIIRRELKRIGPGLKVEKGEIQELLRSGVLKRDVTQGEGADRAKSCVKKSAARLVRKKKKKVAAKPSPV